ncbi:hypothetical protein U5903_04295 [Cereibacter johrii]|uniref:hypothetical protein n=1 Tax=Cereibacter johrii TaxID=445629 RepID=UPI002B26068C|nr:hypothetical protein [Cereibacter johrii]MEA5159989.1 hypothetical protein [Cereibacter johrii]
MIEAKCIECIDGMRGDARLYGLSEPVIYQDEKITSFVVISAVDVLDSSETYIFPADERGNVLSYSEMEGSFQGSKDHARAIMDAGWRLVGSHAS